MDPRWNLFRQYRKSFGPNGEVEFFFIGEAAWLDIFAALASLRSTTTHASSLFPLADTSPYVSSYYSRDWARFPGGLVNQSADGNLLELEAWLFESTATWKIVVGHHPVGAQMRAASPRAPEWWKEEQLEATRLGFRRSTRTAITAIL